MYLRITNLYKSFGHGRKKEPVLQGVDLQLAGGEVVVLAGLSGAGKSTLLHIIAGLEKADRGEISLGMPCGNYPPNKRWNPLSIIFQDPLAALSPHLTVEQSIAEPLLLQGIRGSTCNTRVLEALANVRLTPPEEYLHRYPHQLSGGQCQRVALARAIITRPSWLLADEPTSMLDVSTRAEILELLREQARRGSGILVTMHDLAAACYMADRLLILHEGRIVEEGSPQQILSSPAHPFTRRLVQLAKAPARQNVTNNFSGGDDHVTPAVV
ncbi:MAG: ABC transporter ATP-binding protein [Desulfurispora sp.]|uniref:ABC transporter ATP-binding protein n=1 Tax=Desulfurispora sp. TaxID=3014275 RepID=UPI00404AA79F